MPAPIVARSVRLVAATALLFTLLPLPDAQAVAPCDRAFALLAQAKPTPAKQAAVEGGASFATDSVEKRVCATAEALASDRIARAAEAAAKARAEFDGGDFDAAKASTGNALALDSENPAALAVQKELKARPAATDPVTLADAWDKAVGDYLTPLGKLALMMALVFVALVIVGRVSARLWWFNRSRVAAPGSPAAEWILGMVLVAMASVVGVLALAGHPWVGLVAEPMKVAPAVFAVPALLVGLFGAGLIGWVNARQLRLTVGASSDKEGDTATTGRVLALLETMGGSAPQGLERPYGTDLQGFANALTGLELPRGGDKLAKFVGVLVGLVTGRTPWRVFVDSGQGSTSVAVLRHGRTVGSLVVTGQELTVEGVEGKLPAEPFVAAYVLTVLAGYYTGFEGLAGAKRWRSIGLHYLASTDYRHKSKEALSLLGEAVYVDPANLPAQVDLAYHRWRQAADFETLDRYDAWLKTVLNKTSVGANTATSPRPGHEALWVRTHVARASVAINRYFAVKADAAGKGIEGRAAVDLARDAARAAVAALCVAADDAGRDGFEDIPPANRDAYRAWLDQVRAKAAAMARAFDPGLLAAAIRKSDPQAVPLGVLRGESGLIGPVAERVTWDELPLGPTAHYSLACSLLAPVDEIAVDEIVVDRIVVDRIVVDEIAVDEIAVDRIVVDRIVVDEIVDDARKKQGIEHLKHAQVRKGVADWMPKDPQLAEFWKAEGPATFPKEPRTTLLELPLFEPYADQLKRAGLSTASAFLGLTQMTLGTYTVANAATRTEMLDAAGLLTTLNRTKLAVLGVEVLAYLLEHGQARRAILAGLTDAAREGLAQNLAGELIKIKGAGKQTELEQRLCNWLSSL
nr:hypothetical protein [Propionibacterium sp.]